MQQLDVSDVVLALEVGDDRGRERGGVEPRRIERRAETHRLAALERRAEQRPLAELSQEAGKSPHESGVVFEQQVERPAAITGGERIDPCPQVGRAMIRKATHDLVPSRELVRARLTYAQSSRHCRSSASNRRAAVISGGGWNLRRPAATAPIVQSVRPMIARSLRSVARRMYTRSSASFVLSSLST